MTLLATSLVCEQEARSVFPPAGAGSADEALLALIRHDQAALAAGTMDLACLQIEKRQTLVDAACIALGHGSADASNILVEQARQTALVLAASGNDALREMGEQLARLRKTQQMRVCTSRATVARFA